MHSSLSSSCAMQLRLVFKQMKTRRCKKCKVVKASTEFYRSNGGTSSYTECKMCNIARASAWRKRRCAEDPSYNRRAALKRLYGITLQEYDNLLIRQKGVCAICSADAPGGKGKFFHVDHCHDTGGIRGLLCHLCNTGIGALADDPQLLREAADYLERSVF